jgi:twitching motility protein PilT
MLTDLPSRPPPALLSLLSAMDALQASDLFLSEGRPPAVRVHGQVRPLDEPATTRGALDALIDRALGPAARKDFDRTGDADTSLSLDGGQRYRLSIARQQGALSVVARAVPTAALDPEALGLPPAVMDFAALPRGLVLVTGATGSGKSTTLAALVHRINQTRAVHVVTIEDPIEFVHLDAQARITQREIGADTLSFQAALRHVVRQSPDVIVIGEMRDQETMQVALAAALTGHLVFASLHTIDATQTVQRILSYYPEHLRPQAAMDLSLSLQGIVSQRLLPRADQQGRALACEVLTSSAAVASLLRDQRITALQDLMRTLRSPGIQTFNQSLLSLFQSGAISFEQGMAYASNPDEFALSARGMSTGSGTFLTSSDDSVDGELDLQRLLVAATSRGASDLHLATGRPPLVRIDGHMNPLGERILSDGDMRMLLYSIMTGHQRSTYELERELDFAIALDNGRRFRVNAYFQRSRMAAALRAIPDRIPSAEELDLPEIVLEMGGRAQGLFLVVGPTGSGKSTTLACLLNRINHTRACRIITIEDPVEYAHNSARSTVDQREVGSDTQSFARALKYALRQDPDVLLVGEMRDLETISSALTAAETGHLVLATLHANDATQAIDRMIDVFPAHQQAQIRSMLASSLLGVVSQRLLPRKEATGRVPAFEILVGTAAVRNLIRENKLHQMQSIMERSQREGMVTMDASLRQRLHAGEITYEDALKHAKHAGSLKPPRPAAPRMQPARTGPAPAKAPAPESSPGGASRRFPWQRG